MILTHEILKDLIFCNVETGKFYWKHRPEKYFPTYKSYKQWNGAWDGKEAFTSFDKKKYKVGAIFNKSYKAHRIIWFYAYGEWPNQLDHINGMKSDNRLLNLRNVNNSENRKNMGIQKNNTSGIRGISWSNRDKYWVSKITVDKKEITLGYFKNLEDAKISRKNAEKEHGFHINHGDKIRNGS